MAPFILVDCLYSFSCLQAFPDADPNLIFVAELLSFLRETDLCFLSAVHFCENALIRVPMEDLARAIKLGQKHVEKEYHTVTTSIAALKSNVRMINVSLFITVHV
jgi:hypothetical protein